MSNLDDLENSLFGLSKSKAPSARGRSSVASAASSIQDSGDISQESSPKKGELLIKRASSASSSQPADSPRTSPVKKMLKGKEEIEVPSFLTQSSSTTGSRRRRGLESNARKSLAQSVASANQSSTENLINLAKDETNLNNSITVASSIESTSKEPSVISRPSESLDSLTNKNKTSLNYSHLSMEEKRKLWSRWLNIGSSAESNLQFYVEIGLLTKIPFPWIEKNGTFVNAKDGVVLREHPCAQKLREQIYENKSYTAPEYGVTSDEDEIRYGSDVDMETEKTSKTEIKDLNQSFKEDVGIALKSVETQSMSIKNSQVLDEHTQASKTSQAIDVQKQSFQTSQTLHEQNQPSQTSQTIQPDLPQLKSTEILSGNISQEKIASAKKQASTEPLTIETSTSFSHLPENTKSTEIPEAKTSGQPSIQVNSGIMYSKGDGIELQRLSDSIERSVRNVEFMKNAIEKDHSKIFSERENALREEEKRIIESKVKLDIDQKELIKERAQLNEMLKMVEQAIRQVTSQEEQSNRQSYLDRQKLEHQQELLEKEKREFYEKRALERAEIQRQQDTIIVEQKSLLDQIANERKEILVERSNMKNLEERRMQKEAELTQRLNTFEAHLMKEMSDLEQRKREFELETLNFKKDQSDLATQKYKYTELVQTLERDLGLVQKERQVAERELRDAREFYHKAERERRDAEGMLREKQDLEDSLKLLERRLNEKERTLRKTQKRIERERLDFVQEVKKAWNQRGMNDFEQELKEIQTRLSVESLKNLSQYVTAPAILNIQTSSKPSIYHYDPIKQLHNQMQLKKAISYIEMPEFDPALQDQRRFLHSLKYAA